MSDEDSKDTFTPLSCNMFSVGIKTKLRTANFSSSRHVWISKDKLNLLLAKGGNSTLCSCGSVYIDETGLSVKIKYSEYKICSRWFRSCITSWSNRHQMLFDKTFIVAICKTRSTQVKYLNLWSSEDIM